MLGGIMSLAEEFYKDNIKKYSEESNALSSKINVIGWSRLFVLLLCISINYFLYDKDKIRLIIITNIFFRPIKIIYLVCCSSFKTRIT